MPHADGTEGIVLLSQSLEKTLIQNRALFDDMTRFARDESLRLAEAQLDHADRALSHFRERQDLSGLIGVHQEWMKHMMQDFASSSLRYAEMFQRFATHVRAHVENAASGLKQHAEEAAEDLARMQGGTIRPHAGSVHVEHPHMPAE
jgi:hypothetical protein